MSIWSKDFWRDAIERIVATAAQVLIAVLSVDGLNLANIDFAATASAIVIASVLALAKSVLAANKSGTVSPASLAPSGE